MNFKKAILVIFLLKAANFFGNDTALAGSLEKKHTDRNPPTIEYPLHDAALAGTLTPDQINDNSSLINSRDVYGNTPLHCAVFSKNLDVVNALLNEPANADVSLQDKNGFTALHFAAKIGFAEAIEGDLNSKKHLCLHKAAPIGAILQVKNEVNGQSVFVKVIGKLPETGSNEKIIIRISRQAYERLMASGKRFPVEVSYPESQP
jgi:ankyrin repeat protein